MQIDGTRPDGATARQRHLGMAFARQKRTQHEKARAHLAHDVVIGGGAGKRGGTKRQRAAFAKARAPHIGCLDAEPAQQLRHEGDVGQPRHIAERQRLAREQACGHQRQRRVLGAADGNFALQPGAASYANAIHDPSRGLKPVVARVRRGCEEETSGTLG